MTDKDISKLNIYAKLTHMQNDLLEINIPKSGKNKFGGFDYYELDDLLPPILMLCKEYGCTLYFNFPTDVDGNCNHGVLNLVNWYDANDKILVEVPFPELEKLPKMNYAQSSGTYQTYMKRYLILHTFDIVEEEIIDATNMESANNNENGKKGKNIQRKPKVLAKVIAKCNEENPDKECTNSMLNKTSMVMYKNKEITADERKEVYDYVHSLS